MKTKIPDELKADVPPSLWGKILSATPVVMTVVATMLAGLASSEMTRAQYDRAYAAQLQSKAGDQWNYFQAKKLRGAIQRNSLELLRVSTEVRPLDLAAIEKTGGDKSIFGTADNLLSNAVGTPSFDPAVKAAFDALAADKPETELTELLKPVDDRPLAEALSAAKERARTFDASIGAITPGFDQMEKKLATGDKALSRDMLVARMEFNARRYDAEARLNQTIASLYELQVRKNNISAERHHKRSQKFFFGMLAAQAAVIIATFALAARKRSLLWSLAAAAGIAAVLFAIYVYLFV
ncbi:MAG TPA: DUF4337 family protein [Candidatus Paceibacterota bacterium]|nr:DUF4337 family protein [Candidatus Paceibacterota bacterium]